MLKPSLHFSRISITSGLLLLSGLPAVSHADNSTIAIGVNATATDVQAVAVGTNATSNGYEAVAFGPGAFATGMAAAAFGAESQATANGAVAFGSSASATANNSVAIGNHSAANGSHAVAIGSDANVGAFRGAVAIGEGASAQGVAAIAIGGKDNSGTGAAAATADKSMAIGANTTASKLNATAIGFSASAAGVNATAFGVNAKAETDGSTAIGANAAANNRNDVALGTDSTTAAAVGNAGATIGGNAYTFAGSSPSSTVSIGHEGAERTITNVAAGRLAATSTDAVNGSQLSATNEQASVNATNIANTTVNLSALTNSITNADIGPVQQTGTLNQFALVAPGGTGIAPGVAQSITNLAAGTLNANSSDAVNGSQLFATNSLLDNLDSSVANLFNGAGIKYFHSNSTLDDSLAAGENSLAVGPIAFATAQNAIAIGNGAVASVQNSIALGAGTNTDLANPTPNVVINGTTFRFAGGAPVGVLSIGSFGNERQLTNVAAGKLSSTSTDAVNGSQLFELVNRASNSQLFDAADAAVQYDDKTTKAQVTLNSGGQSTVLTNVADAELNETSTDAVNGSQLFATNAAITNINNGAGIKYFHSNSTGVDAEANGVDSAAIGSQAIANGVSSVAVGASALSAHDYSVALGASSVTTLGAENGYNAYRLSGVQNSVGEIGIGTNLGNRKVTGMAAGTLDSDGVNVAQLKAVGNQLDLNTSSIDNLDGRVTTLESSVTQVNDRGTKYFHANSTKADATPLGADSVAMGPNAESAGKHSVAIGNDANASGSGSLAIGSTASASAAGSVALGEGASDGDRGSETYKGKYSGASNVSAGTVSIGNASTGQTRTLSNVADGTQATDAVNVRQLDGAVDAGRQYTDNAVSHMNTTFDVAKTQIAFQDNRITAVEGDVNQVKAGTAGMFQTNNTIKRSQPKPTGTDAVAGGADAVASGNNSTAIGTSSQATAADATAIGDGAKATADNSAALGSNSIASRANSVSVGDFGAERQVTNVAAGSQATDAVNVGQLNERVTKMLDNGQAYTDQRFSQLSHDLKKQDDTLSAGIAGAMAMASLPQPYSPGASMTALSVGNYRGQSSMAVGMSRISDNGHWVTKLQGTTDTQRQFGAAVGVGYQW